SSVREKFIVNLCCKRFQDNTWLDKMFLQNWTKWLRSDDASIREINVGSHVTDLAVGASRQWRPVRDIIRLFSLYAIRSQKPFRINMVILDVFPRHGLYSLAVWPKITNVPRQQQRHHAAINCIVHS